MRSGSAWKTGRNKGAYYGTPHDGFTDFIREKICGCEEQYKANHDGLMAARGDVVDPGPDSNFSIWSAGCYVFGYNEIDTTMEREETPEEHDTAVAWETRQLDIMDWITNDCDWLTGQIHSACHRLAWHA